MDIWICDDDYLFTLELEQHIKILPSDRIRKFNSGKELLREVSNMPPDIVFLDIEMPGEAWGLELCNKILKIDKRIIVIFITIHKNKALEAYEAGGFQYIIKPVNRSQLDKVYSEAYELALQLSSAKIAIDLGDEGIVLVRLNSILYVESKLHKKVFVTKSQTYSTYKSMKEVNEILDNKIFIQVHRSYIVNLNYIRKFDTSVKSVVMGNGKRIPVSDSWSALLEEKMIAFGG